MKVARTVWRGGDGKVQDLQLASILPYTATPPVVWPVRG